MVFELAPPETFSFLPRPKPGTRFAVLAAGAAACAVQRLSPGMAPPRSSRQQREAGGLEIGVVGPSLVDALAPHHYERDRVYQAGRSTFVKPQAQAGLMKRRIYPGDLQQGLQVGPEVASGEIARSPPERHVGLRENVRRCQQGRMPSLQTLPARSCARVVFVRRNLKREQCGRVRIDGAQRKSSSR